MQRNSFSLPLFLVAAMAAPASAAGLLEQLPADGTQIVYDMELTSKRGGADMTIKGKLTVGSVGKVKVDEKDCRWIEVAMAMTFEGMEKTTYAKILIPESEFGAGKDPIGNVKRGWLKRDDREATEIKAGDSRSLGPLPVFFPGPLSDVKKLDAAKVKTGLGELDCTGVTGTRQIKQEMSELNVAYETRVTDKSPGGVASGTMTVKETRNGMERPATSIKFTLKSVGKDAKSALPDKK